MLVVAVDPGDKHVGLAWWRSEGEVQAQTVPAEQGVVAVETLLWAGRSEQGRRLVIEDFVLYPGKAGAQSYKRMETSEMIGALKWVARKAGAEVAVQGAYIKNPTRRQMAARGLEHKGDTVHARDAELHLIHYSITEGLWNTRSE